MPRWVTASPHIFIENSVMISLIRQGFGNRRGAGGAQARAELQQVDAGRADDFGFDGDGFLVVDHPAGRQDQQLQGVGVLLVMRIMGER